MAVSRFRASLNRPIFAAAVLACSASLLAAGPAEDWPNWRGPRGDGISHEQGLIDKLPDTLKPVWNTSVGVGYSSPIARSGVVYIVAMNDQTKKDILYAIDAATGKVNWKQTDAGKAWPASYPGPRATPAIDGEFIYTYSGAGDLTCRALDGGKVAWSLNVLGETKGKNQEWGMASSPLVRGENVYVQGAVGGPVAVAVNKTTGKIGWQSKARSGGYSAPIMIDVEGTPQLVCLANKAIYAINPADGTTIWSLPWETQYDVNAATPVYHDGNIFVTSDYGHGCMMVSVTAKSAKKDWENKEVMSRIATPVFDGDHLYANSEGTLKCLSWPDGKVAWQSGNKERNLLGMGGSILRFGGDKAILLSERGRLSMVEMTPKGYRVIGSIDNVVEGRQVWSTPLIYDGKLYAKGDNDLVCIDIKAAH